MWSSTFEGLHTTSPDTYICCFPVVIDLMHVPCQTEVCNLHGIIISNQNVSGRKITMNALSNEDIRIKIRVKKSWISSPNKTNATFSNSLSLVTKEIDWASLLQYILIATKFRSCDDSFGRFTIVQFSTRNWLHGSMYKLNNRILPNGSSHDGWQQGRKHVSRSCVWPFWHVKNVTSQVLRTFFEERYSIPLATW